MDDKPKFNLIEIAILMMLALANDGLEVLADLGLAIPVIGQVFAGMAELANAAIFSLILLWFIMKLRSFGAPALFQTAGGIAEFIGIPGRTAAVIVGIYLVNHPKVAAVASLGGAVGAGALAESAAGEAGAAAETGAATGKPAGIGASAETKGGIAAEEAGAGEAGAGGGGIGSSETAAEGEAEAAPKAEVPEEEFGMPEEPLEKLRKSLQNLPEEEGEGSEEEENGISAPVAPAQTSAPKDFL